MSAVRGRRTAVADFTSVAGARLLSAVIGAGAVVIATRLLAPAGYAKLAYVQVLAGLVFAASSTWTVTATVRYGREEFERRGSMAHTNRARMTILLPAFAISGVAIMAVALAGALPHGVGVALAGLAVLGGIATSLNEHCVTLLEAQGRMRAGAVVVLARQGALVVLYLTILVAVADPTASWLAAAAVAASLSATVPLVASLRRRAPWAEGRDRQLLRRLLGLSIPLIWFTVSTYVMRSVDIVVLGAFGTAAQVGVYALAYQVFTVLQQVPTTATTILSPLFVSMREAGHERDLVRYVADTTPQLTFFAGVATGLAIPFAPAGVDLLFGPGFGPAGEPIAILLVALLLYGVASLYAPVLVLHERGKAMALASLAAAVVNVAGDVILVGPLDLGIRGPAVATGLGFAVLTTAYARLVHREVGAARMRIPWSIAIPVASAGAVLAASGTVPELLAGLGAALVVSLAVYALARPWPAGQSVLRNPQFRGLLPRRLRDRLPGGTRP